MSNSKKKRVIVIGNGMVGYKYCEKLVAHDEYKNYEIVTFCEEPNVAYDRVKLSSWFDGKSLSDLTLAPIEWYKENDISLYINELVTGIDRKNKTVTTNKGTCIDYDKVILATGSFPFVPPLPGKDLPGVFVYRTIEDLEKITEYSKSSKTAAVIGGGLLGLEAAKAMVDLGLKTHVIEFAPRLMPRQIDQVGSDLLKKEIEALGVSVHMNMATKAISGDDKVNQITFTDDISLDVDMVVISAGIRPRDELAKQADIAMGERGGIIVNDQMQTSDENIYAIGECALHKNFIYGLVAPGYRMAETAVDHMCGGSMAFTGADMSTKLKLMGVDVSSIGNPLLEDETIANVTIQNEKNGVYKKISIDKNTNTLVGAILVGDNEDYGTLYQYYLGKKTLPETPESLIVTGDEHASGADAMDDDAQICSCENISKGQLVDAIAGGCKDLNSLKKCSKAGTGCGSCVPLVTQILNAELEKSGETVCKHLCEHFEYTRQELVQIIRASKISTFEELIQKHGKGHGCEICKPTVGSILASYVNDYILESPHMPLQDTNDRSLANMQKNGTYSVVPRVPGGELLPEHLIVMGEVAKEFNLYTKVTGGQRIDLFGARLEDLPKIWAKLIDAGLESGHAYAKSVRTVKSCVGQTWCRFGVQDSTGMAIRIEHRYKGIRMPHKTKLAVSGCARECAEAQSKDVGIIATDKGWNLYVCGNGGMKPQHALLLAQDLDDETLIQYIDRFFMYYIRTADRLQRTAPWFNQLPGGLKHLQEVIIDDSLGLAKEFENEMQHLVDTYQCEWKTTIENPEKIKHFRTFVNSEKKDETMVFVEERNQYRPATEEELDNRMLVNS